MVAALLMLLKVTRLDVDVNVHAADETVFPFIDNWHDVKLERVKAEGKVTDISKLVLKVVMALSWMVYLELVERAVLGETVEEATVKLTCAFRGIKRDVRHMQMQTMTIGFMILVLNYINKHNLNIINWVMTYAIRKNRVDKKIKMSQRSLNNVELPKIKNKVEEANTFLANPLELSKASEKDISRFEGEKQASQPWMQNNQNSESLRKQRSIKMQIANLLGNEAIQDGQVKVDNQISTMSPQKIISKMKKYQPINSSFSNIYSEKKSIDQRRRRIEQISQEYRRKILNLPSLNLKGQSKQSRVGHSSRMKDLQSLRASSLQKSKHQPEKYSVYFNKIKQIYKQGNNLHHKSEILINRIDRVSEFLQKKYDQFDEHAHNMLEDVGTYKLQEETDGSYKRDLLQLQKIKR